MGTSEPDKVSYLAVDVMRRCDLWGDVPGDAELTRAAQAAFAAASAAANCEISLVLTSDEEICALNKSWRGKDEPTNVLSFPLGERAHGDAFVPLDNALRPLGDVVLAFEIITREADMRKIEIGQHAAHLVVHGVLHLLGYDHANDSQAETMENLETRILATLGLPDPYALESMRNGEAK